MNHAGGKIVGKIEIVTFLEDTTMTQKSPIHSEKLDRFLRAMARVLRIPRKRLDKMMFQGLQRSQRPQRRSIVRQDSQSSNLVVK
jgi:hypothetical protein